MWQIGFLENENLSCWGLGGEKTMMSDFKMHNSKLSKRLVVKEGSEAGFM